jgi:hypothetical protein
MYAKFCNLKINQNGFITNYQQICHLLASITDCNLASIEWHKLQNLTLLIDHHSLSKVIVNSSKFLGHVWPC